MPLTPPTGYSTAFPLTVRAQDAVSSGYAVRTHLTGALAAHLYGRCHDQRAGSDLTVWYQGSQIDADVEMLSSGEISLWHPLPAGLAAGASDANFVLALGNPSPVVKQNWANIYPFSDDFLGSSLDGSKWTAWNGPVVSVASSILTIGWGNPANHSQSPVHTAVKYGPGICVRGRGKMPFSGAGQQRYCIHNGDSDENPGPRYQSVLMCSDGWSPTSTPNTSSTFKCYTFDDSGLTAWHEGSPSLSSPADGNWHVYNIARDVGGYAHGWVDDGGVVSVTTDEPVPVPGWAYLSPYGGSASGYAAAGSPIQQWDWCKVRPFVPNEPVVSLGVPVYVPAPTSVFFG